MAASRVSKWLRRRCVDAITHRWSPVRFVGRWYSQVVQAEVREIFDGERPVTWGDLSPIAKPATGVPEKWVKPGGGATP